MRGSLPDCNRCGARMADPDRDGEFTCRFCGNRMRLEPVAPPPNVPPQIVVHVSPRPRPASRVAPFLVFVVVLGLGAAGAIQAFLKAKHGGGSATSPLPVPALFGGGGAKTNPFERVMVWADGGALTAVTVDGREFFVTGRRQVAGGDHLWVVAVDAESGEQRWSTPSLGSYSRGYQAIRYVVAGSRVVYTDPDRRVNVVDLASGKLQSSQPITDRARSVCLGPDGRHVNVDTIDGKTLVFDPASPEGSKESSGRKCAETRLGTASSPGFGGLGVSVSGRRKNLEQKALRLWVGYRQPGTALPLAAASDPSGKKRLWLTPLFGGPDADVVERSAEFADGSEKLLLTHYLRKVGGKDDEHRLVLIDAASGKKNWDVPLRGVFAVDRLNDLALGERFALVTRMASVEVHALADGHLVATYGDETYDER